MNQHFHTEEYTPHIPFLAQPVPDDLMKTLIGVYARLWKIERTHSQILQTEHLLLQTRGLLVCIENYCLNGIAQTNIVLTDLVNRLKRLQDSLFFASTGKNNDEITSIANTVAETVRFAEASMPFQHDKAH